MENEEGVFARLGLERMRRRAETELAKVRRELDAIALKLDPERSHLYQLFWREVSKELQVDTDVIDKPPS